MGPSGTEIGTGWAALTIASVPAQEHPVAVLRRAGAPHKQPRQGPPWQFSAEPASMPSINACS